MKRKLALLIAAVMTVATVPSVAFASTKLTAVDEIKVATDKKFTSKVELKKDNDQVDIKATKTVKGRPAFDIYVTLTNGKFAYVDDNDDNKLIMTYIGLSDSALKEKLEKDFADEDERKAAKAEIEEAIAGAEGILAVEKESDTKIKVTLDADVFNQSKVDQSVGDIKEPTPVEKPDAKDYVAKPPKAPTEVKEPNAKDYETDVAYNNAWNEYNSYLRKLEAYKEELAEYESGAAQKAKDKEYEAALAKYEAYLEEKEAYDIAKGDGTTKANATACVLPITAKAGEVGDVVAKVTSNVSAFKTASEVIATAQTGKVEIASEGVKTFVEDSSEDEKAIKDITIDELTPDALKGGSIKLKLSGNWKITDAGKVSFLNEDGTVKATAKLVADKDDEIQIDFAENSKFTPNVLTKMTISGVKIKTTKKCKDGDVATITVSSLAKSKEFSNVKLEVAKMVKEEVTYSVEDKDLPVIWSGADNDDDNTLKVSVEENTGDILNTSRKATFTFPEGIEVVNAIFDGTDNSAFTYEIDENVVTIKNYSKNNKESEKTDFNVKFIINAAPTFTGDVKVKLGGQFDDKEYTVATVKAPYTVSAKTSEVLIDYRYVPVNDIVITEAEEGILKEDDQIILAVEKMDFEDAGKFEVTEGDIDVDVDIDDNGKDSLFESKDDRAYLTVTVNDESTEASTIVVSGLELYLDRTLPVGGYALQNIGGKSKDNKAINILWENSSDVKKEYDADAVNDEGYPAIFKYKAVTVNDSYVDVITSGRDKDDSTTHKKVIITVGASTMAVGTETVNLDAPAYINSENYTMLPVRAISEAFGATVNWDAASRTVTVLSGQRIISMTIGSRTMYINGTPVAMNTTAAIVNDRTFIPVRDLANSLGISAINWTEASGTVTLN